MSVGDNFVPLPAKLVETGKYDYLGHCLLYAVLIDE